MAKASLNIHLISFTPATGLWFATTKAPFLDKIASVVLRVEPDVQPLEPMPGAHDNISGPKDETLTSYLLVTPRGIEGHDV